MPAPASYLSVHARRIVQDWADELAHALQRPAAELAARGLAVGDFRPQRITLLFDDGSEASFAYAFAISSAAKQATAVFTEHCGVFVVPATTQVRVEAADVVTAESPAVDD